MHLSDVEFKRLFSFSPYKDMKIPLSEMSFSKDLVNDTRGDLYPLIFKDEKCKESVLDNQYHVSGRVGRMFCQFFPYGSYSATIDIAAGEAGFLFKLPSCEASVTLSRKSVIFKSTGNEESVALPSYARETVAFTVSCRPSAFDVYLSHNGGVELLHSFKCPEFSDSNLHSVFSEGYVALYVNGECTVKNVGSFIDNGVSLADMRTVRYENGEVMVENGRIYFTASVRLEEGTYQGVFSWLPGTMDIKMTGAVFYDAGDGRWCSDVAASLLYHREWDKWLLWVCSFSHGHILAHAEFEGDIRFGVNVVDVELMKLTDDNTNAELFLGFSGDEDPDFFYSREEKKWYMSVCRLQPGTKKYRYVFFKSDSPFENYECIGMGNEGEETGGSFVHLNGERYFVCGNSFKAVSDYRIYDAHGMKKASFNFPDGGFRGWGTVIPLKMGTRTRLFWLTFDRHRGSSYNWSYGNVYCFEGYM